MYVSVDTVTITVHIVLPYSPGLLPRCNHAFLGRGRLRKHCRYMLLNPLTKPLGSSANVTVATSTVKQVNNITKIGNRQNILVACVSLRNILVPRVSFSPCNSLMSNGPKDLTMKILAALLRLLICLPLTYIYI